MLTIGLGPASALAAVGGGGALELADLAKFSKGDGNTVRGVLELNFGDSVEKMFYNATYLTAIKKFDTSRVKIFKNFLGRSGITELPDFDFSEATDVSSLADSCSSLVLVPELYFPKATTLQYIFDLASKIKSVSVNCPVATSMFGSFWRCTALTSVKVLNSTNVDNFYNCFNGCTVLETVLEPLRVDAATDMDSTFENCKALKVCKLHGLKTSVSFEDSSLLTHESILYTIENAQTVEESQTITLHADVFAQLSEDEIAIATEKGFSVVSA